MEYKQLFESDPNIKYIEIGTLRKCYWDMPYNPDKFKLENGKIRCKQETTEVSENDLPLLHYYDRQMVEHIVIDISEMFMDCKQLKQLDISNWNVGNVTDMSYMFYGCASLNSLDLNNWNTSNVTNMIYMFNSCFNLRTLNIFNWDTQNVIYINGMFNFCTELQTLNIDNWNVNKVRSMGYMFEECPAKRPDWYKE